MVLYENHYFVSHVELGVVSGVFEGADHEKEIIGSLFHHLGVVLGSKCPKRVHFNRNLDLLSQVELGVAVKVFKDADH